MRTRKRTRFVKASFPFALIIGLANCGGEASPAEPVVEDDAVLAALEAGIQDEFKAELIYERVLDDFGSVRPFVNIINAEERHSEAIARLYVARGLPVPESRWASGEIPSFSSVTAAFQAGVVAEIENAEIYDHYLALPLPADVQTVFENNRAASLDRHLPAFEFCS